MRPRPFSEGELDADKLEKPCSVRTSDVGARRYSFSWAGKRERRRYAATADTRDAGAPDRDDGVDFDEAQHVIVEGENLEVLKVLCRSYLGGVKMIYIDPPYNTGNDFIYCSDDFADPLDRCLRFTGQKNGDRRVCHLRRWRRAAVSQFPRV